MQQPSKALSAYQKALEMEPSNAVRTHAFVVFIYYLFDINGRCNLQEALEGYKACSISVNSNPEEVRKRAMSDPEVQAILRDPAMRLILEQMQNDPKALYE